MTHIYIHKYNAGKLETDCYFEARRCIGFELSRTDTNIVSNMISFHLYITRFYLFFTCFVFQIHSPVFEGLNVSFVRRLLLGVFSWSAIEEYTQENARSCVQFVLEDLFRKPI